MPFQPFSLDPRAIYNRKWYLKHRERIAAHRKQVRLIPERRVKLLEWAKTNYYKHHTKRLERNREKWKTVTPEGRKRRYGASKKCYYKRKYGMTIQQRDELLARQGGCAICKSQTPRGRHGWHVDHCHVSGRVRGILCNTCNLGLGALQDSPEICDAAANYLRTAKVELA
jgi:hypothetical protein